MSRTIRRSTSIVIAAAALACAAGRLPAQSRGMREFETVPLPAAAPAPARRRSLYEKKALPEKPFRVNDLVVVRIGPTDSGAGAGTQEDIRPEPDRGCRTPVVEVAARVVDVRPNGNLVIEGRATCRVDDEEGVVTVFGEVASGDVDRATRAVRPERIADVELVYSGRAQGPRSLGRTILSWLASMWPF